MSKRIYLVKNRQTGGKLLVRANSQAQAVKTAANNILSCAVASQEEIVYELTNNNKVIDAGGDNE